MISWMDMFHHCNQLLHPSILCTQKYFPPSNSNHIQDYHTYYKHKSRDFGFQAWSHCQNRMIHRQTLLWCYLFYTKAQSARSRIWKHCLWHLHLHKNLALIDYPLNGLQDIKSESWQSHINLCRPHHRQHTNQKQEQYCWKSHHQDQSSS